MRISHVCCTTFKVFDRENTDRLRMPEILPFMAELGWPLDVMPFEELLEYFHRDKNDTISYDEFMQFAERLWLQRRPFDRTNTRKSTLTSTPATLVNDAITQGISHLSTILQTPEYYELYTCKSKIVQT